jgi:hypothetical protein
MHALMEERRTSGVDNVAEGAWPRWTEVRGGASTDGQ